MSKTVAKYQKYAEYQDAGVEWLKGIPKNWFIGDLRRGIDFLTDFEANGSFADVKTNVDLASEEKFAWYVRATDLQNQRFEIVEGNRTVDSKAYSFLNKTALYGGELLVAKRGEIGKVYLMPEISCRATLAPNLYLIRLNNLLYPKYTFYWFLSLYGKPQLELADKSTTIGALYKDDVKACRMLYPSYVEQTNIGNFLDHETAKIDSLIVKQKKLIELLKEKRQAVISHAVTKGLNPNVPMKDSGVEWLGEVPEHWITSRLKYYTNQIVDGAHFTPTYTESGIPFLRVTDIHNDFIDMENIKYIPKVEHQELIKRCLPKKGDLLLSKNGTIGIPKLVNWDWEFSIFVSLCLIKFKKTLMAEFAEYFFKSYEIQEQIFGLIKKSTVINLHLDKIQNFWFSIPSVNEQIEIVNFLNHKTNELDNLISKAELAIQLMQERRTALISAAVTGKIDVRNWQNPTEAKMEFSA